MNIWWMVTVMAFAMGYWWGRQEGITKGAGQAKALTPLELREQALLEGRCPICLTELMADEGENCQASQAVIE